MKKSDLWSPTQRELRLYDELVKKSNQVRRVLKKSRNNQEKETPVGRLPALVVPTQKKSSNRVNWRRIRREMSRQEWRRKLKEFKLMFGEGMKSYLRETYKKGYLLLWQEHIGELPEGKFGRYSEEQMAEAGDKMAKFMEMYNRINGMSPIAFYHMAQKGFLVDFQFIYDDLGGKEFGFIDQQIENISLYWKTFGRSGYKDDKSIADLSKVYRYRTFKTVATKEAERLLKKKEEEKQKGLINENTR